MVLRLLFVFTILWPLKLLADDLPDLGFLNETSSIDDVSSTPRPPTTSSFSSTQMTSSRPRLAFGMDLHCPSVENAVSTCPKDTNWVYYVCCGGANMYCCEHIQTWILTALAAVACLLALVVVGCCVRCCCSYKRKTQSYRFDDK